MEHKGSEERKPVMENGASSYRRFLAGDDNALREIIELHKDGLALYLNTIVRNICTAEELTEEVFVELVVKKPEFSDRSSFSTWLYAIGRNIACDYIRKSSRRRTVSIDELYQMSDEEDIEKNMLRDEQRIRLRRALSELDSDHSQVLFLNYFGGFSNEETAEIMNRSKRQIENLTYRAKQALRTKLESEGFEYEEY